MFLGRSGRSGNSSEQAAQRGARASALSPEDRYISYWQVPWANFEAARTVPGNLDGEPTEFTRVRYEAAPGAVRTIVPSDCPMIHCQRASYT